MKGRSADPNPANGDGAGPLGGTGHAQGNGRQATLGSILTADSDHAGSVLTADSDVHIIDVCNDLGRVGYRGARHHAVLRTLPTGLPAQRMGPGQQKMVGTAAPGRPTARWPQPHHTRPCKPCKQTALARLSCAAPPAGTARPRHPTKQRHQSGKRVLLQTSVQVTLSRPSRRGRHLTRCTVSRPKSEPHGRCHAGPW